MSEAHRYRLDFESDPIAVCEAQQVIITALGNAIRQVDRLAPADRTRDKLAEHADAVLTKILSTRSIRPASRELLEGKLRQFLLYVLSDEDSQP